VRFNPGDLVNIVSRCGDIVVDCPPALILERSIGYPLDIMRNTEPEEIYTILIFGSLEYRISADWLRKV